SLDRGMDRLRRRENIKAHRPRFGPLASHSMPDRLLDVLRHQCLELAFRPLMLEKGLPGIAEQGSELRPRVRRTHIGDTDGLDARPRLLCIDEVRRLTGLDAAPELLLRRDQDAE